MLNLRPPEISVYKYKSRNGVCEIRSLQECCIHVFTPPPAQYCMKALTCCLLYQCIAISLSAWRVTAARWLAMTSACSRLWAMSLVCLQTNCRPCRHHRAHSLSVLAGNAVQSFLDSTHCACRGLDMYTVSPTASERAILAVSSLGAALWIGQSGASKTQNRAFS